MSENSQIPMNSLNDYLDFLEEYWTLFTPPSEPKPKVEYTLILL